ncbi:hypothetical protein BZL30_3785 [Mycobacterium kansasii]|uniref:Uncharacterized protein n=1 Tax=Mycobacterium kansasii TaxID=1768 RepID=A0A1V3XCP4_MYCKA|nr:hypothetical protein BZL30_3785 [Mycobacterium kansasii]
MSWTPGGVVDLVGGPGPNTQEVNRHRYPLRIGAGFHSPLRVTVPSCKRAGSASG